MILQYSRCKILGYFFICHKESCHNTRKFFVTFPVVTRKIGNCHNTKILVTTQKSVTMNIVTKNHVQFLSTCRRKKRHNEYCHKEICHKEICHNTKIWKTSQA
jgi:hypothetical protein